MHRLEQDFAELSRQSMGLPDGADLPPKTRVLMVETSMVQPESVISQTLTLSASMQSALSFCRQRKRGRHRRFPK